MKVSKWQIVFVIMLILAGAFIYIGVTTHKEADVRFAFISSEYMNPQQFKDNSTELEVLMRDANGDGENVATIEAFSSKDEKELSEKLQETIEDDETDIIIADKEVFENYKNKSVFFKIDYIGEKHESVRTLDFEDGRPYAINVKGNTVLKRLGMKDTDNLYIASLNKDVKTSIYRKNGRNICLYLLENKDKYNF